MMSRYESRVKRLRWLKWEWAVDEVVDGKVRSTIYGTITWPSLAYQRASVVRDHLALEAMLKAVDPLGDGTAVGS